MAKKPRDTSESATKKHDNHPKNQVVVVSVRGTSPKQRMAIGGSLVALFAASALISGAIAYTRNGNQANASTQGLHEQTEESEDYESLFPRNTALIALPSTSLFQIDNLTLGTTKATIRWSDGASEATVSSPFKQAGTYRITYTTDVNNAGSWRPVGGKLGSGVSIHFVPANGDQLASWQADGYNPEDTSINVLPADTVLGGTYYYRAEMLTNGSWQAANSEVAKLVVPQPIIEKIADADKSAGQWTGTITDSQFGKVNPVVKVSWKGNGNDDYAPNTYLFVSSLANMAGKQAAVATAEAKGDGNYMSSGSFVVAQKPATTAYYAIYDANGKLLSNILQVKTP